MFSLKSLFKSAPELDIGHALYAESVTAARHQGFFTDWGIPDTPTGRFEVLALIAFLVLHRLKKTPGAEPVAQAYFDIMFDDLDSNLRELGVGDLSVGKKVKKLAESFYGRLKSYDEGLIATDNDLLEGALRRNLFHGLTPAAATLQAACAYVREQSAQLDTLSDDRLNRGEIEFSVVPAMAPEEGA